MNYKNILASALLSAAVVMPTLATAEPLIPTLTASYHWGGSTASPKATSKQAFDLRLGVSYQSHFVANQVSLLELGLSKNTALPFSLNLLGTPLDSLMLSSQAAETEAGMHPAAKAALIAGGAVAGVLVAASIVGEKALEGAIENQGNTGSGDGSNSGSENNCGADITLIPPSTNTDDNC